MEVQCIKRKVGGFFSTYRSASVVHTEASPVKVGQLNEKVTCLRLKDWGARFGEEEPHLNRDWAIWPSLG